ncbi:UNVERIFIED_CONTAM: hypothetical protein ABIC26_003609 [Paenibacillus sp. PvR008]
MSRSARIKTHLLPSNRTLDVLFLLYCRRWRWNKMDLQGKVAVVAGATRGAGRAIAVTLGEVGATVYCTGRSVRGQSSDLGRTETIEETAEMVTQAGGLGIAVQVDHTEEEQVRALFARIEAEQDGRLDILNNDVWGGERPAFYRVGNALLCGARDSGTHLRPRCRAVCRANAEFVGAVGGL